MLFHLYRNKLPQKFIAIFCENIIMYRRIKSVHLDNIMSEHLSQVLINQDTIFVFSSTGRSAREHIVHNVCLVQLNVQKCKPLMRGILPRYVLGVAINISLTKCCKFIPSSLWKHHIFLSANNMYRTVCSKETS